MTQSYLYSVMLDTLMHNIYQTNTADVGYINCDTLLVFVENNDGSRIVPNVPVFLFLDYFGNCL